MPKLNPHKITDKPAERVFLNKRELAARYGVTVALVNKWLRERRIPVLRFSRQLVRFDPIAVDAALQRYVVPAQSHH